MSFDNEVVAQLMAQRDELAEALREINYVGRRNYFENRGHLCAGVAEKALANIDSEPAEQPAVPVAWSFVDVDGKPCEFCEPPEHAATEDLRTRMPLYAAPQPPAEQLAMSERWSVEHRDGMYLVHKRDSNGSFLKGTWIDPDQHSHVLCEMLSDMQHGGRK